MQPPEAPYLPPNKKPPRPGMHLWRFLRPEFVKKYKKPLSSDTFSAFYHPQYKKERIADNKEVQEATLFIFETLIPTFAKQVPLPIFLFLINRSIHIIID